MNLPIAWAFNMIAPRIERLRTEVDDPVPGELLRLARILVEATSTGLRGGHLHATLETMSEEDAVDAAREIYEIASMIDGIVRG
jgi:hypothetical protein